jgi:hypothetical protein
MAAAAKPEALFQPCAAVQRPFGTSQTYDVSADGARFLFICDAPDAIPAGVTVIVNWQSRLR